jgi:UPF0755 protein
MNILTRAIAVILAIVFAYFGFEAFRFLAAGTGRADERMVFEIPAGRSFQQIAAELEAKGLVLDDFKLRVLAKLTRQDVKVKRGEYELNRGMTPQEILSLLVSGKSIQYPVTFPEGSNIYEMAALLEGKGLFKAEEFLKACAAWGENPETA